MRLNAHSLWFWFCFSHSQSAIHGWAMGVDVSISLIFSLWWAHSTFTYLVVVVSLYSVRFTLSFCLDLISTKPQTIYLIWTGKMLAYTFECCHCRYRCRRCRRRRRHRAVSVLREYFHILWHTWFTLTLAFRLIHSTDAHEKFSTEYSSSSFFSFSFSSSYSYPPSFSFLLLPSIWMVCTKKQNKTEIETNEQCEWKRNKKENTIHWTEMNYLFRFH